MVGTRLNRFDRSSCGCFVASTPEFRQFVPDHNILLVGQREVSSARVMLGHRPFGKLDLGVQKRQCNYHAIEAHVYSCHFCNNAPITNFLRDYESPQ